ncbi:MAG: hypothetical protein LBT27_03520, partial [Prevotellaceae bacterium]|nr:hypothetical protein [Prevotellaceae bacterium]
CYLRYIVKTIANFNIGNSCCKSYKTIIHSSFFCKDSKSLLSLFFVDFFVVDLNKHADNAD